MEDIIQQILIDNITATTTAINGIPNSAREIDKLTHYHYMRFVEWLKNNTSEEIYKFWHDNIEKK